MRASHRSLLWLGEPRLNLYLIRQLHRGRHSSWWEGLRSAWMAWLQTQGLGWCPACKPHRRRLSSSPIFLFTTAQRKASKVLPLCLHFHALAQNEGLIIMFWLQPKRNDESLALYINETGGKGGSVLLCTMVTNSMGDKERQINLSLTGPDIQHPSAKGSYGQQCDLSHKLTKVLFHLSHICTSLPETVPPPPHSQSLCFIFPLKQMKIDYLSSCLDRWLPLALCLFLQTKLPGLFFCLLLHFSNLKSSIENAIASSF